MIDLVLYCYYKWHMREFVVETGGMVSFENAQCIEVGVMAQVGTQAAGWQGWRNTWMELNIVGY